MALFCWGRAANDGYNCGFCDVRSDHLHIKSLGTMSQQYLMIQSVSFHLETSHPNWHIASTANWELWEGRILLAKAAVLLPNTSAQEHLTLITLSRLQSASKHARGAGCRTGVCPKELASWGGYPRGTESEPSLNWKGPMEIAATSNWKQGLQLCFPGACETVLSISRKGGASTYLGSLFQHLIILTV